MATCLRPLNVPTLIASTISYSNPQNLQPAYFEYSGISYPNLLRINFLIDKF